MFTKVPAIIGACALTAVTLLAQPGPDAIFEKPPPASFAKLDKQIRGVAAVEVNDFAYPGYTGVFEPSPPHADLNPRKAVIIGWQNSSQRFIFSHEASYCPFLLMSNGLGLSSQFFEGNDGWAELFNNNGRKTRNSFVDIIQSGPKQAWVRWNYFCVNANDDSKPALRGTEDYIAYPNGLVWRRLTYESLQPANPDGYSWQPIDFFAAGPPRATWRNLVRKDPAHGDYHVAAILDAASGERYDLFFGENGEPRRNGDNARLQRIAQSPLGFAMVIPCLGSMPFIIFGNASGFDRNKSQLVDHSFNDTGGFGWGASEWDHWPVAWINSQEHKRDAGSPYPFHFGPMSHFIVSPPLTNGPVDYFFRTKDMELNRWSERHVYYALIGAGSDFESIRKLARRWLESAPKCASAETVQKLPWPK
jgi:hypothetical protein